MPGFSYKPGDPREEEWADRIVQTITSVVLESAPEFEDKPAFYASTESDPEGVSSLVQMALALQLDYLLPRIGTRVVSAMRVENARHVKQAAAL